MNKSGQFYIFSSFISLFLSITVVTAVFQYHLFSMTATVSQFSCPLLLPPCDTSLDDTTLVIKFL